MTMSDRLRYMCLCGILTSQSLYWSAKWNLVTHRIATPVTYLKRETGLDLCGILKSALPYWSAQWPTHVILVCPTGGETIDMAVMSHVVSGIAMSDRSNVWPEIVLPSWILIMVFLYVVHLYCCNVLSHELTRAAAFYSQLRG